jgi:SAM-dependent methyltransferase
MVLQVWSRRDVERSAHASISIAKESGSMKTAAAFGLIGVVAVVGAVARHLRGAASPHKTSGGILMGDPAGYNTMTGLLLRSFYRGVADDIVANTSGGVRILEVGCGPGHLAIRLAKDHRFEITGVDLDPKMIDHARANAARHHGYPAAVPSFQVGDAASLPFPDDSFDVVVSTLSMHHWTDPVAGLTEIGRVLAPEGRGVIWDLRPGRLVFHRQAPDPLEAVDAAPLDVLAVKPWRWPGPFTPTQRIELRRAR